MEFARLANAHPATTYEVKATLFRASVGEFAFLGHDLGWGSSISELEVFPIASDHYSIMAEPAVFTLGRKIAMTLGEDSK